MIKQVASRKISRLSVIGVFTFVFGVLFNTACSQVVTNECGTITIPEEWSQTIEFSWPFSVAIYEIKENKTICDGTLISKRHVLTAANCFQNENRTLTYGPTEISVVLGTGVAHDNITEILFHPDWELFYKTNPDADVAILVLENEVTLSNDIQIVCLPVEEDIMQSGVGVLVGSDFTITNYTKSAVGVGRDVTTKSGTGSVVAQDDTTKNRTESVIAANDTTKNKTGSVIAANDSTKNETGSVIAPVDTTKNETGSVIAPVDTTKNETGSVIAPVDTTKNGTGSVVATNDTIKNGTGSVVATNDSTKNETGSVIVPVDTPKNQTGSVIAPVDTTKNETGSVIAPFDTTKNETGSVIAPVDTTKNSTGTLVIMNSTVKNGTVYVIGPNRTIDNSTAFVVGWDDVSVPGLVSFIKYIEKYGARRYGTIRNVVKWEMVQRISLINVLNNSDCNKENFPRIFCGRTGRTWPSTRVSGGGFFTYTDNAWVQHGIAVSIRNTTINSTEHSIVSLTRGTSFKNWIGRVVSESGEAIGEATIGKINLTCDFSHLYSGYACVAYGLEVTNRNFAVEKLVGAHQPKKNNRDVEFIQFHSGTMKHLLNGIGKLFPNLKSVLVGYSDSMSLNTVFIRRCNFQHMENVFEIVIHKSSIETVPDDLLWDLPNLERFQLDGKLIEIPERLFERNFKLQEVYLASNELTFLPRALFRRNLDLKWVNFERNRLQFIEVDFMFLPNIQYVFLADNICIDRYLNKAEETDEDQFVAPKEIDNSVPLKSVSKLQRLIYSNCSFYG